MYILTDSLGLFRSDEGPFAGLAMTDLELWELGGRVLDSLYEENA